MNHSSLYTICAQTGQLKVADSGTIVDAALSALEKSLVSTGIEVNTPFAAKQFLQLKLGALAHEAFGVMFLTNNSTLIAYEQLFRGTLNETRVYTREIIVEALKHNAKAIIIAHNHPSGCVEPSKSDIELTSVISAACALVDISLIDHIVVTSERTLSLAEKGLMRG